ncbi:GNAT family N-acetyltransferase [Lysinibacillus cavernae]|uniref:GNAT family N-acetyltransferase n=1 Tax=Lysinibacillus cavernae TaxID=2666135 RepID=UPI0012D9DDDF|nr:GNAT family N-acetyltransferase [Lysinibacillus cavernae]
MLIDQQAFQIKGLSYTIRCAQLEDAQALSNLRYQLDGETENFDREQGEAFIDKAGFEQLILNDTKSQKNLCLVAVVADRIVGFSRCEGSSLKRLAHKVTFGVGVSKDYWGYGIGKALLQISIDWADANGIQKMALEVLETNGKAVQLYEKLGFAVEGILKNDKRLADGKYYHTIIMGRWQA